MPHFIAFYKCSVCQRTVAGLVSDTWLFVSSREQGCLMINPHEVKIDKKVEIFCPNCAPAHTISLETKCYVCKSKINFFYWPEEVTVIKPDGESMLVMTKTLLAEHIIDGYCSIRCLKKRRPNYKPDPPFLEFKPP